MDTLFAPRYDETRGRITVSHRSFVSRLIELTPAGPMPRDA
jgi:hypothetical protein